jgi:hypothetical protein
LRSTVTDDSKPTPPGALTHLWSQISGPASGVISNANLSNTRFWMPVYGKYTMRLQSTDGELVTADEVDVNYFPAPEIISIVRSNSIVTVTCEAVPGRTYVLRAKGALTDSVWATVSGGILANDVRLSITTTNAEAQRFYRVSVQ